MQGMGKGFSPIKQEQVTSQGLQDKGKAGKKIAHKIDFLSLKRRPMNQTKIILHSEVSDFTTEQQINQDLLIKCQEVRKGNQTLMRKPQIQQKKIKTHGLRKRPEHLYKHISRLEQSSLDQKIEEERIRKQIQKNQSKQPKKEIGSLKRTMRRKKIGAKVILQKCKAIMKWKYQLRQLQRNGIIVGTKQFFRQCYQFYKKQKAYWQVRY